jgi:hypothetical protein
MHATPAPEWLNIFYSYLVFKSLPIIGQCLANMNILAPKIGPSRWTSKNKMVIFLKTIVAIFIRCQQFMETIFPNKTGDIFSKIMLCALGAQMRNVVFVETHVTGQMDLIVVWYSLTSSGQIMCCVFATSYRKMCFWSFLNTESEVHSSKGARPRKRKAGGGYGYFNTLNSSKIMHKNKVYRQPNRKPGDTRQFSR